MNVDDLPDELAIFHGLEPYIDGPDPHAKWGARFERQEALALFGTPDDFDPWTSDLPDFLGQATWWRPDGQPPILIDDMDPAHIGNLFRMLDRNLLKLVWMKVAPMWSFLSVLRGEMAILGMEGEIDRAEQCDPRHSVLLRELAARCVANRRATGPWLEAIS